MKNETAANCPVSDVKVNEKVVRTIALLVVIVSVTAAYHRFYTLSFLLAIDFALRAFTSGEQSVLRIIAVFISSSLRLKSKPVDGAPKKFAASLGFIFSLSAGVLQLYDLYTVANIVIALLVFCALLEGLLSVCIGCIVYNWLHKLRIIKNA